MKGKSVLLSWGISYLVFIFITIFIIATFYLSTVRTLRTEIMTSNDLLLNNVQNQIDSVIEGVKLLSDEIGLNKSINRLQYMNGCYDTIDPYIIYEAHSALRNYYKVNPSIKNIYVYYKKSDMLLSNTSANNLQRFYEIYFRDSNISYENWKKIFEQKYENTSFVMIPSNKNYIFNIVSYPFMSYNDNYMTVIIEINKDRLFVKLDESAKLNNSSFFMLNSNDQILPLSDNNNNELLNDVSYEDLHWQADYTEKKIGKEKIIYSYIASKNVEWKYVVGMPEKIFWQHSRSLLKMTILAVFAAIVIGGIVMRFSLHYNYNPINELLDILENKYGYHFNNKLNEYYFIRRSFDNVATEQERTKALLETQNKALSSAILSRLIRGNTNQLSTAKDMLFHCKPDMKFESYGIILFYIESFEGVDSDLSTQKNLRILEEYNFSQFILNNIADEVISQNAKYISMEIDNMMVYVIDMDPNFKEDTPNHLMIMAEKIKSFIDAHYDFDITTAVSKLYHDISTISDCFYEAIDILEYKHILGSDNNIVYENIDTIISSQDFYYPPQKEHELIQGMKSHNLASVKATIEDLFKQNINTNKSILEINFCLMLSIISTCIKIVSDTKDAKAIDLVNDLEIIKRVQNCNTSANIKNETLYIVEYIATYIKDVDVTNMEKEEDELVKEVMTFVENNYTLMDLSVTYIADILGVNPVQMSKTFRNTISETLPDYINKCRIEHAKKIMKKGYNNLEELAMQVGYNNTKTLTRAFNKYVGMSPGRYKDTMNL